MAVRRHRGVRRRDGRTGKLEDWARFNFHPAQRRQIEACAACCAGEPITRCYREDPRFGGRCPVADDAPDLDEINDIAVDIFFDLLRTAQTLEGEKKTIWYMKADEFAALCDIYDVVGEEKLSIWAKVKVCEEVWNETRPNRKKPKGSRRRRR